jgi:hypothetical protein
MGAFLKPITEEARHMTKSLFLTTILLLTGCAEPYTAFHTQTGDPIILGRRAYSYDGCLSTVREEAARLQVSLSAIHIRGSWVGRSLLWPFEPGYACEATIGPERLPHGIYLNVPPLSPQG